MKILNLCALVLSSMLACTPNSDKKNNKASSLPPSPQIPIPKLKCLGDEGRWQIGRDGIYGGTPISSNHKYSDLVVGIMEIQDADHASLCTGVPLASNVILTAAHCVHKSTQSNNYQIKINTQSSYFCRDGFNYDLTTIDADEIEINPLYDSNYPDSAGDLALIKLKKDLPKHFQIGRLSAQAIRNSIDLRFLLEGYGRPNPFVLKFVFKPGDQINLQYSQRMMMIDQFDSKGICSGDSGGPVFLEDIDGQFTVVGINSYVSGNIIDPCTNKGFATKPSAYIPWIQTVEAAYKSKFNYLSTEQIPVPPENGFLTKDLVFTNVIWNPNINTNEKVLYDLIVEKIVSCGLVQNKICDELWKTTLRLQRTGDNLYVMKMLSPNQNIKLALLFLMDSQLTIQNVKTFIIDKWINDDEQVLAYLNRATDYRELNSMQATPPSIEHYLNQLKSVKSASALIFSLKQVIHYQNSPYKKVLDKELNAVLINRIQDLAKLPTTNAENMLQIMAKRLEFSEVELNKIISDLQSANHLQLYFLNELSQSGVNISNWKLNVGIQGLSAKMKEDRLLALELMRDVSFNSNQKILIIQMFKDPEDSVVNAALKIAIRFPPEDSHLAILQSILENSASKLSAKQAVLEMFELNPSLPVSLVLIKNLNQKEYFIANTILNILANRKLSIECLKDLNEQILNIDDIYTRVDIIGLIAGIEGDQSDLSLLSKYFEKKTN